MKKAIIGATIATLGAACAIGIARGVQRKRINQDVDELFATMTDEQPPVITEADLAEQPEPVGRWLRYSGVVGKPMPRAVRLKQQGEFRLEGRGWMPFEAEEYYTTNPPGFVWVVAMRMLPLVSITGRDQYRDGEGSMKMRLSSLIPVVNERGGMLNQGAMLRFLNEIMWFPAAALSPYISWQANDENSAIATMTYGGVTAPATFSFDDEGRLIDMVAERYNDARDGMEIWSTPITGYGEFGGVRIPIGGVGVWKYGSGDFPYVRLCVTDVEYDVAERY